MSIKILDNKLLKKQFLSKFYNYVFNQCEFCKNGKSKIQSKSLDLIIANDILDKENGFESDTNKVSIIHPNGDVEVIPTMPKYEVGNEILDRMIRLFNKK